MPDSSKELAVVSEAYESAGGDPAALYNKDYAGLVVSHNRILFRNDVAGVHVEGSETPTGVKAKITVEAGAVVKDPVHLCFGVIPQEGLQEIVSDFEIGERAKVKFVAHCFFPNALKVKHVMDARIHVGKDAEMTYSETHYHGEDGGVEVLPVAKVVVEEGGIFNNEFKLIKGAAGEVRVDYFAELKKDAVGELNAKIYGKKQDKIVVRESISLNGENARGLAKSRIVASDHCTTEVIGEAVGNAPNARGHVDCVEIIRGKDARASAVPRLLVVDERAKLTHEAAIGSVDKKQIETLMARGLTEEMAVDVVVRGMLG
jgi:Fe-S cluster assembly scaffold protein SufB